MQIYMFVIEVLQKSKYQYPARAFLAHLREGPRQLQVFAFEG